MVESFRMRFLIFMIIIGLAVACEDEIKQKLELLTKGKTFKSMFEKYAPTGFIFKDDMENILSDAGVGYWCRWPDKVISRFDLDGDEKLSLDELRSNMPK